MTRLLVPPALVLWLGATLVISDRAWARRSTLARRVLPYLPAGAGASSEAAMQRSAHSVRAALAPMAAEAGDLVARLSGVTEPAATRLIRIGATESATDLRTRQATTTIVALLAMAAAALGLRLGPVVGLVLVVSVPSLAFLWPEHQLATASRRYQERLALELPVVAEQLGMLLSAGWSLGGALGRIATRGSGVVAADLARVCGRIRQGLDEHTALTEWAELAEVDGLHRLVAVLALQREAADLGALISEEARTMRADAHRHLLEVVERRAQQVWVPVTIATLVPGLLFLAVPFLDALRAFTEP